MRKTGQTVLLKGNFIFFTTTMRLHFCISDGNRQVVHDDNVIVIPGFHLYFTTVKRNYCLQ